METGNRNENDNRTASDSKSKMGFSLRKIQMRPQAKTNTEDRQTMMDRLREDMKMTRIPVNRKPRKQQEAAGTTERGKKTSRITAGSRTTNRNNKIKKKRYWTATIRKTNYRII